MDCHSSKKTAKPTTSPLQLSKGEPQRVKPSCCSKHNLLQKQMLVKELISFKSHSRLGAGPRRVGSYIYYIYSFRGRVWR